MELQVIGTGSSGNCYILTAKDGESIIIEQGVKFEEIQKALDHDFSKVQFGLCTHSHFDHSKSTLKLMESGIKVLLSKGDYEAPKRYKKPGGVHLQGCLHNTIFIANGQDYKAGNFQVWAFNINHDTTEPLGFLIHHPECGLTLFLTDTYYIEHTFEGLNNIIIEANFCEDIISERFDAGYLKAFLRDRIYTSHLSINSCIDVLKANDLSAVNNILLVHLSDSNGHAKRFQKRVYDATLKNVTVAQNGLKMKFNKTPFM